MEHWSWFPQGMKYHSEIFSMLLLQCVTKSLCYLGEDFCWTLDSNLTSVLIALNTFCTLELILIDLFSKLITDRNSCSRRERTISSLKDSFSGSTFRIRKMECFPDSHFSPSLFSLPPLLLSLQWLIHVSSRASFMHWALFFLISVSIYYCNLA